MYEVYFGLSRRPFSSVPHSGDYFPAGSSETARQNLARCVRRSEGVGVLIGPAGTGKTMLCQLLADEFRQSMPVARLASGRLGSRRALFQAILYELGRPYRGMDEGELRLALCDYLTRDEATAAGTLLIVDEAHALPLRLLEEIRLLTNLTRSGQPCVRLVLAGGAVLEERFASPRLESFAQRISARCYLEALNGADTTAYVHANLNGSGGRGEHIFPAEACRAVYQATGGIPRLINQVCDHALLVAFAAGQRRVEPAGVEEAWAELQQLPTPWNASARPQAEASVIEFGGLSDDDLESPASCESAGVAVYAPMAASGGLASRPCELRLAGGIDDEGEPAERLEQIQAALGGINDEYQPSGTFQTEVELVFDDLRSPFEEPFQAEEVVVDRYAAAPPRSFDRPWPMPGEQAAGASGPPLPTVAQPAAAAAQLRSAEVAPSGLTGPFSSESHPGEPATLPMPALRELAAMGDDEDLIVLEEEGDDDVLAVRPAAVIRRQEYGRLFARLRRTS